VEGDVSVVGDVLLTEQAGNVLVLTLNRPEVRNALNPELKDRLVGALHAADADPGVRVVVITGAGPIFCPGMDLKAFAKGADFGGLSSFYKEGIAKPVIAALNGSALGGGFELALACDLIVAAQDAKIGMPEVKRGLYAAGGGTTLSSRIPLAMALELGLTGDPITAGRAQELGLVNKVVPAGQVLTEAMELAERIAANAPLGVAITKKLMRERRWGEPDETASVFRSADAMEGARAFAERRTPVWTGK
jgi:enoyl-CoA hydratase